MANQMLCYKKKSFVMKNQDIYDKWTKFINDENYEEYFKT